MRAALGLASIRIHVAGLVAAAVLLGASPASAKDFCIDVPSLDGNPDFVLMGFKPPKPGRCDSFAGLAWARGDVAATSLHGAACTPSSGDRMNFTITLGVAPSLDESGSGRVFFRMGVLALPSLQGRMTFEDNIGLSNVTLDIVGFECNARIFCC